MRTLAILLCVWLGCSGFVFSVVGDSQGDYDPSGEKNLNKDRVVEWQEQINPISLVLSRHDVDFSLHVGDIVEDGRYQVSWDRDLFSNLRVYLDHAPVYPAIGNHEYNDSRFWEYFDVVPEGRAYYSWTRGNAHFIVLDTERGWYEIYEEGQEPEGSEVYRRSEVNGRVEVIVRMKEGEWESQMSWLEAELEANKDKPFIFVSSHHPVNYKNLVIEDVRILLEKYKVTAAFAGHRHVYAMHKPDDVFYFQSGGMCTTNDVPFQDAVQAARQSGENTEVFTNYVGIQCFLLVDVKESQATVSAFNIDNVKFAEYIILAR